MFDARTRAENEVFCLHQSGHTNLNVALHQRWFRSHSLNHPLAPFVAVLCAGWCKGQDSTILTGLLGLLSSQAYVALGAVSILSYTILFTVSLSFPFTFWSPVHCSSSDETMSFLNTLPNPLPKPLLEDSLRVVL